MISREIEIVKSGEPYDSQSVELLCVRCILPDCDETQKGCLIQIARRRDKRLHENLYYQEWLARNPDKAISRRSKEAERKRRFHEKKRKEKELAARV